jgi:hypothetical protein
MRMATAVAKLIASPIPCMIRQAIRVGAAAARPPATEKTV